MTSTEVVRADASGLEQLDPAAREAAVTLYLTHARDQLAQAVEMTGPAAVAQLKAEIATAAEATKQLGLSKEIQTDAQEMVRRAEYALGKAIRAGQERGEIAKTGDIGGIPPRASTRSSASEHLARPSDFVEGSRTNVSAIYDLSDDVSETEFDAALSDAKAEGNLSRANVVRKIQGVKAEGLTPVEKLKKIRALAPSGMTSQQIGREVGCTEEYVREIARNNGIEITADKVMRKTARLDSVRIVESTVLDASNLIAPSLIEQVDFAGLPRENLGEWISSLSESIKALRSLKSSLEKELHRV